MNRRLTGILLIAFVVAVACSYLVFRIVGNRLGSPQHRVTAIVAATGNIKLGSVLRNVDLTKVDIVGALPQGAILKPADAVGRGVIADLYSGEPILESRLALKGSGGGLAATIPDGMRACAVKVDEVVGVAGFATPGMRVDVLISGNPPGTTVASPQGSQVRTLLQNIQVLSAGTDIQRDAEGKPQQVQVVNLLVTPQQAEALSLASNQTKIQLILRNPLDTKVVDTPGTGLAHLYGEANVPAGISKSPRPVHKAPPPARVYLIEVFNGSKKTEAKFASHEEKQ